MVQKFTNNFIRNNFTAGVVAFLCLVFGWMALMRASGQDSIIETIVQVIIAIVVVRVTYRTYQLRRHFVAIRLLRQVANDRDPYEPRSRAIIELYLKTIPGYDRKIRPYERVLEMSDEQDVATSDITEKHIERYCEKIVKNFSDQEISNLMAHLFMMGAQNNKYPKPQGCASREAIMQDRFVNVINAKFQRRMNNIEGAVLRSIPNNLANSKRSKINDLRAFELAVSYLERSKLQKHITDKAVQMKRDFQRVKETGDFDVSLQAIISEMLGKDLPALVTDYDRLISVARGSQREEGEQAFIKAFTDIADRFDSLVEIHTQTAIDTINTRANYIRSVHGVDKDNPFSLNASGYGFEERKRHEQ